MFERDYEFDREYDERDEDESQAIGRCEECGELIYDDNYYAYINGAGDRFCSIECVLSYYGIRSIDDCM